MIIKELPSSSEHLTLGSVKAQFTQWRATRTRGMRIPHSLWEAVNYLVTQYDYHKIGAELKLNPNRLRAMIDKRFKEQPIDSSEPNFIECPLQTLPSFSSLPSSLEQKRSDSHAGTFEFTRTDGTVLKASGLNHQDLCSLIKGFLGL